MNHPADPAPSASEAARSPSAGAGVSRGRRGLGGVAARVALAAALAAALLVGACGGATEQYDPFSPKRLLAFGDEASALGDGTTAPLGANWSVNGVDDAGNFGCSILRIWTQSLAAVYGFVFPECNPNNVAQPQAKSLAKAGAKVADVAAQVAAQETEGIGDGDLATVLVGTNDILGELYPLFPGKSEDELKAEANARGQQTALLVNHLVALGAKVIVANVPDLGLTPFAIAQGADRAALISRLSAAFNAGLGIKLLLDGRYIGLVQIDQRTQIIAKNPGGYGFSNANGAVCKDTAPLPTCRTDTLIDGGSATLWLWADDRWFSIGGQSQLATMAIDRATRNPF